MTTLMVSTLPPTRCGVAAYAAEHMQVLCEGGRCVQSFSPAGDSDSDFHFDLSGPAGAWKWYRFCRSSQFDEVHMHYVDLHYFPWNRSTWRRMLARGIQSLALRALSSRSGNSSVVIHELPHQRAVSRSFRWLRSRAFSGFNEAVFHTESMMRDCLRLYPGFRHARCRVVDHNRYMRRKFEGSTSEARSRLGLPAGKKIFLCIGFLHAAKGFQDVVEAFGQCGAGPVSELHLVGSLQKESPVGREFVSSLSRQCSVVPGAILHECFPTDDEFDCWLAAADVVMLPYLGVISSGVGARASLYGKPLVVRNLPSLTDQFPQSRAFSSTEELAAIIADLLHTKE